MSFDWLQPIIDKFAQNPWLVWAVGGSLLIALLMAIYISRKFSNGNGQEETWPYRLSKWLQSNSLGLAIIALLVFLFGAIGLITLQMLKSGEPNSSLPSETAPLSPTSLPSTDSDFDEAAIPTRVPQLSITLHDAVGTPLPELSNISVRAETTDETITATPINAFFLLTESSLDYYKLPDSLPIRFDVPPGSTPAALKIEKSSSFVIADLSQWYLVCCVKDTKVWVSGNDKTIENSEALKYVPTEVFPTSTLQFTPTPTPTAPYLRLAESASVINLYTGPDESFPLAAQLGPGIQLEVNGKTADGKWYRVCCFDMGEDTSENTLWVRNDRNVVKVDNEPALNVWATPVLPPPTPLPVKFSKAQGPEALGIDNNFFTIYVKVVGDPPGYTRPLPGYFLTVEFKPVGQNAFSKREASNRGHGGALLTSTDFFSSDLGGILYNYKFEYMAGGDILDGDWRFWLTNAQGEQLSELVTFTSKPKERGVYVVWHQVR